jgi:transposase
MLFVHLTNAQQTELAELSRQAVGRVALRAQMVLLSDRGYRVPAIAAIHGCGPEVVRLWLHRYQADGAAGLADQPRSGRPPADPLARQIVDVQASQSPPCTGHVQSCWTVALLTAFLAVHFGLTLSTATVRRHLHATGWRWRRPRLAPASILPAKRDPEAPAKWAAITGAARRARRGRCHLLFLDECDLQLLPVVRACWQKGPRLRVPTPGTNARRAVFGALDAVSGACFTADHERKLAVHFVAFLDRLAAAYPTGPLVLVMDNVATHHAKVVRAWLAVHPRVQVLWLPKYAGHEANPIERIWGLLKDTIAANRLSGSLDELTAAARRFFATLAPHPVPPSFFATAA